MARGLPVALVLALLVLATPPVAGTAGVSAPALAEKDSGGFVLLAVGGKFNLSLGANPSAGYGWRVAGLDGSVAEMAGESVWVAGPVPGGDGSSNWTFEGKRDGETTLRLEYARSSDRTGTPIRTFSIHIVVGHGNFCWNLSFLAAMAAGAPLAAELARRRRAGRPPPGQKEAPEAAATLGGPGFAGRLLPLPAAGAMGLAGIMVMAAGLAGSIALYPRFSLWDSNVSELGVTAGSIFFNWGLITCGSLGVLFSTGLGLNSAPGRPLRLAGAAILAASMAALAGIGIFTEAFGPAHFYVAVAFFALYVPASLVLGLSLSREAALRPAGLAALVSGGIGLAAWFLPSGEGIAIPELVAAVPGMLWLGLLAWLMVRRKQV